MDFLTPGHRNILSMIQSELEDKDIVHNSLLISSQKEAEVYCVNALKNAPVTQDILKVLEIADAYKLFQIAANAYTLLGNLNFKNKDFTEAFINYSKALDSYEELDHSLTDVYLYKMLGLCKANLLQYTEALYYFDRARHFSDIGNNKDLHRSAIYNIALCYKKLNKLQQALDNITLYLELCDNKSDFTFYVYGKILKANCLEETDNLNDVLEIYFSLIDEFEDKRDPLLGLIHNNLGLVFMKADEQEKSLEQFNLSEKIRRCRDPFNLSHTLIEKSRLLIKSNCIDNAVSTLKQALEEASKHNDTEWLLRGYFLLCQIYDTNQDINSLDSTLETILKIAENLNDDSEISRIYSHLSSIYLKYNNITMSKHCLNLLQIRCVKDGFYDI